MSVASSLAGRHGFAVAAIDGPVHGDRRADPLESGTAVFLAFAQAWAGDDTMTDTMVSDWRATLTALQGLPDVGDGPVGWWGLSMGTILGLPLVAAEPRIDAAVLGLMGTTGPTHHRIETDAAKITCPVLFLVQWDDELFSRGAAIDLFDRLAAADKRLHAHPGRHGEVPDEAFSASLRFLVRRLSTLQPG